jgi:hypothetical protein
LVAVSIRIIHAQESALCAQVLLGAEAREAKLVAAEEALLTRRQDLERQAAARLAEAEAAVRRLQVRTGQTRQQNSVPHKNLNDLADRNPRWGKQPPSGAMCIYDPSYNGTKS